MLKFIPLVSIHISVRLAAVSKRYNHKNLSRKKQWIAIQVALEFTVSNKKTLISWCIYDWAAAPFPSIITTFIFATYFTTHIAADTISGTSQWANATAIAGVIIAILSPIFGAIADHGGRHKIWLLLFTLLCMLSTSLLWFAYPAVSSIYYTLTWVVLGTISLEIALVFYNSFLPHISPEGYIGRISGWAWGVGYIGGIIALSIVLFVFINPHPTWLDTQTAAQVRICGPLVALWFGIFSLPLFIVIPDTPSTNLPIRKTISQGISELLKTLKELPNHKNLFLYLIAHLIYIDGLNTVFAFGGIYAAGTFGMDMTHVILFGISMNLIAGIGAIALAWTDDYLGSKFTILISIIGLTVLSIPILLVHNMYVFWGLALVLAIFVGPVQAASRSLMARISPLEKSTEMFGLYALSGRVTSFVGPWVLGLTTLHFHSQRAGMATVLIFFIIGGILMGRVQEKTCKTS
jgi:UMF1 family MFS transporter